MAAQTELRELMMALDSALTGNPRDRIERQIHHYPADFEQWIEKSMGANNPIWYLSDSGYSRVVYDYENGKLFLTYNSLKKVVDNWEAALPQRQAVEAYCSRERSRLGFPLREARNAAKVVEVLLA